MVYIYIWWLYVNSNCRII